MTGQAGQTPDKPGHVRPSWRAKGGREAGRTRTYPFRGVRLSGEPMLGPLPTSYYGKHNGHDCRDCKFNNKGGDRVPAVGLMHPVFRCQAESVLPRVHVRPLNLTRFADESGSTLWLKKATIMYAVRHMNATFCHRFAAFCRVLPANRFLGGRGAPTQQAPT